MSASDTEAITPAVLERLREACEMMPRGERCAFGDAQSVLWYITRWARGGVSTEAIVQIAEGTQLVKPDCEKYPDDPWRAGKRRVRRALTALAAAGLIDLASRGGGRNRAGSHRPLLFLAGESRSGSTDADSTKLGPSQRTEFPASETPSEAELGPCGDELSPCGDELSPLPRSYPPSSASLSAPALTIDEIVTDIVASSARRVEEHREQNGFGRAGSGARSKNLRACQEHAELIAHWYANGARRRDIETAVVCRVVGEDPHAVPTSQSALAALPDYPSPTLTIDEIRERFLPARSRGGVHVP